MSTEARQSAIDKAAEWIAAARSVAVLTGAGISAESGVPTFRGPGGLWNNTPQNLLPTPDNFARNPKAHWERYAWRRENIAQSEPNPGHLALAELERQKQEFLLVTQNVDDLHERAGSRRIARLHGDINLDRCTGCAREGKPEKPHMKLPPFCECGAMLRPGVVWFGEPLPDRELRRAFEAAESCDLFLVVGTSSLVYPAAAVPQMALQGGARVIEVNLEPTALSPLAHLSITGKTGEILPQLLRRAA